MVVLAHLQGVAATFRVGRHHYRGPLHEGRGLTHALTHIAPTDLTVAAALVRKACSKRRRSRLWSKPVNLRMCGHRAADLALWHSSVVQMSASPRVIRPRAWPDWSLRSARSTARCLSGVPGAGREPDATRESARARRRAIKIQ